MAKSPSTPRGRQKTDPASEQMDAAQEALFREVEEDLRSEQLHRLWKRFGGYLIGAAVAVVVVVAGMEGWRAWQASVQADEAQRYFATVDAAEPDDAQTSVQALQSLANDGRTGYAALAALRRAELLANQGDKKGAISAYDAISADGGMPQPVRDLASMLAALQAFDVEDALSVRGRLQPMTVDGNPWRPLAEEMLALLDTTTGDTDAARATYETLTADRNIPHGVRQRATDMLALLGGPLPSSPQGQATGDPASASEPNADADHDAGANADASGG